jgi:hypothetical protein
MLGVSCAMMSLLLFGPISNVAHQLEATARYELPSPTANALIAMA